MMGAPRGEQDEEDSFRRALAMEMDEISDDDCFESDWANLQLLIHTTKRAETEISAVSKKQKKVRLKFVILYVLVETNGG